VRPYIPEEVSHDVQAQPRASENQGSRADGEITKEDSGRAILASETNLSHLQNKEILHRVPVVYRVDNEVATYDPVGLSGVKLEAEVLFITAFSQNLKNALNAFEGADVEIEEVSAAPLAAAEAVLEKREKSPINSQVQL